MLKATVNLVKNGVNDALTALKDVLTSPCVGLPINSVMYAANPTNAVLATIFSTAIKGVPILAYKYAETNDNDIGTQVVMQAMDPGGSYTLTDNIAPRPRVWSMEGYINPDRFLGALNSVLANLSPLGMGTSATLNRKIFLNVIDTYLRWIRSCRMPFYFYTRQGEKVQALIKHLVFEDEPEAQNAQKIKLEVMEYNALRINGTDQAVAMAAPALGTLAGGSVIATTAASALLRSGRPLTLGFIALATTQGVNAYNRKLVNLAVEDATYSGADLLADLKETLGLTDEEAASLLFTNPFEQVNVVTDACATMVAPNSKGSIDVVPCVSVPVTVGSNSITFDFRLGHDNLWRVTEKGSIDGVPWEYSGLLSFNTWKHHNADWTWLMSTVAMPFNDDVDFYALTYKEQADAIAKAKIIVEN